MICQKCKKREATRHESVRNEDGTWSDAHLCDPCAENTEVTLLTPASLVQALIEGAAAAGVRAPGAARSCPKCGISYAEFRARGRLGCPHDYEVFAPEMVPLLERIHHGGSQHLGKSPSTTGSRSDAERELIELRRSLTEAVQREQYEEAARIRDRIRVVEEGAAKGAPPAEEPAKDPAKDPAKEKKPGRKK